MDLAPPSVNEFYVNHEEHIAAANTWAEAHDYALNIKRGIEVGVRKVGREAMVEIEG